VKRLVLSEKDRVGIGTFQPKDEKNQDSTELTGDINYRKIAEFGSDSDPRAFNFDGEFCVANRGIIEFIEILKLDVAFLYDLLGATQEHKIKPKKFPQTDIDEVIIGHTNEAEYKKLLNNEFMEALRDRTIKIDIPYITKLKKRSRSTRRTSTTEKVRGKHIAPHTIEMAAMWAVLTRLEEPKKHDLSSCRSSSSTTARRCRATPRTTSRSCARRPCARAWTASAPATCRTRSATPWSASAATSINPFMVLNELEGGLKQHSLITNEEQRKRYSRPARRREAGVRRHRQERGAARHQRRRGRHQAKLCANYIDNVKAYTQKEKVKNKYTGQDEEPDERLMRSIEEKIDIPRAARTTSAARS
jgi:serine protein kinase